MEYIVIPVKDKSESIFFLNLFKRMNKKAATLSGQQAEDIALLNAMKQSEKSDETKMENVLSHLDKVISGK